MCQEEEGGTARTGVPRARGAWMTGGLRDKERKRDLNDTAVRSTGDPGGAGGRDVGGGVRTSDPFPNPDKSDQMWEESGLTTEVKKGASRRGGGRTAASRSKPITGRPGQAKEEAAGKKQEHYHTERPVAEKGIGRKRHSVNPDRPGKEGRF